MAIPLLNYCPTTQNQRVAGFNVPDEDTPRIYRLEDCASDNEAQELIWAAYRQVFSEHVILTSNRQTLLESQLKNQSISVRDFIRGLARSEVYRRLVVETNSNYRIVQVSLKRLLGRDSYNQDEEIAWSIVIATQGWGAFVDALVDSEEYNANFGDNTVPYQRRRYKDRPFNLVTPRYSTYWRDKLESARYKWGDINNFLEMASTMQIKPVVQVKVNLDQIKIPDTSRSTKPGGTPVSISPSANFPGR